MNNPIIYNGKEYPVRYLNINGGAISTIELSNDLLNEDADDFVNQEAEDLDNEIQGYVSEDEINLPDDELEAKCREYGIID